MHGTSGTAVRPGTSPTARRLEVVEGLDRLAALAPSWRACYAAAPAATPFASPEWCLSWWARYARPQDALAVVVRAGGEPVAVLPLVRRRVRGVRVLALAGGEQADYLDAAGLTDDDAAALAAALAGRRDWDALDLRQLPPGSALHALHHAWGGRSWSGPGAPTSRVLLPAGASGEALARQRSASFAKRVRQVQRRAAAHGIEAVVRPVTEQAVREALERHRRGWADRPLNPEHATERFASHLATALPALGGHGEAALLELVADGRVLLSRLLLRRGDWLGTYLDGQEPDADSAHLQLVVLQTVATVELASAQGVTVLDHLRGLYEHKQRWPSQVVPTSHVVLARGPRGLPHLLAVAARSRAARSARLRRLLGR